MARNNSSSLEEGLSKGLFLPERNIIAPNIFSNLLSTLKKASTWKNLEGFKNNSENFHKRLRFSGLNTFTFLLALAADPKKIKAPKDWRNDFAKFEDSQEIDLESCIAQYASLHHFSARGLVAPYISQLAHAARDVGQSLEKINWKFDSSPNDLTDISLAAFLPSLEYTVRRAVILEINVRRLKNELPGSNANERYNSFINLNKRKEHRETFHKKYPVLARLVHSKLGYWKFNSIEMFKRTNDDWQALHSIFKLEKDERLIEISAAGDTHNKGKTVNVLTFSSGRKIVYKPRSISIEESFQNYIEEFNKAIPNLNLTAITTLNRGDYGWIEFIDRDTSQNFVDLERYYFKLGALLAIVYSINGVDVFFENLIVRGDEPVIVDLETMFHTSIDNSVIQRVTEQVKFNLQNSVLGIGILPMPSIGAQDGEIFDISVIGAKKNSQAPYQVMNLANFGRDDICISEVPGWIPEVYSPNQISEGHQAYYPEVLNGFDAVIRVLMEQKRKFTGDRGLLRVIFGNSTRRLIVRDTKTYGRLQDDETHPDLLHDQVDREWYWDNLWGELKERKNLEFFIESELAQVYFGDIPYFYGSVEGGSVFGGDGSQINLDQVTAGTPISLASRKIAALDDNKVNRQRWYIASSLGLSTIKNLTQPNLSIQKSYLENAIEIGKFILDRLVVSGDAAWIETTTNPVGKNTDLNAVNVVVGEPGLYDGVAGIVYFLSHLSQSTAENIFADGIERLLIGLNENILEGLVGGLSGFTGKSSLVYCLNNIETLIETAAPVSRTAEVLVNEILEDIESESELDVLTGISGVGLAVMPYTKKSKSKNGIQILRIVYERLLENVPRILSANQPIDGLSYLRGFSHGLSGIALAVYRIGRFLGKKEYLNVTEQLIMREAILTESAQWTDTHFFNDKPLTAWCHGSPGILLSLEKTKMIEDNPSIRNYRNRAYEDTILNGSFDSKCLCHGSAGNGLILRNSESLVEEADKSLLLNQSCDALVRDGFSSFGAAQTLSLGLMTGLSGAGYSLLIASGYNNEVSHLTLD